ncbi:hypothetical protein ACQEVI_02125 [Promicromonospora sp. CA-289599]
MMLDSMVHIRYGNFVYTIPDTKALEFHMVIRKTLDDGDVGELSPG